MMPSPHSSGEGFHSHPNHLPFPPPLEYEPFALASTLFENVHASHEEWQNALRLYVRASFMPQVQAIERAFAHTVYEKDGEKIVGDYNTLVHMQRVSIMAVLAANRMYHSESEQLLLMTGSRMHDAGKLVPEIRLLSGVPNLSDEQRTLMDSHAARGLEFTAVTSLGPIVQGLAGCHHMYQARPYGANLPMDGRRTDMEQILATVDALEAMTAVREYRQNEQELAATGAPVRPPCYTPLAAMQKLRDPTTGLRVSPMIFHTLDELLNIDSSIPPTASQQTYQ